MILAGPKGVGKSTAFQAAAVSEAYVMHTCHDFFGDLYVHMRRTGVSPLILRKPCHTRMQRQDTQTETERKKERETMIIVRCKRDRSMGERRRRTVKLLCDPGWWTYFIPEGVDSGAQNRWDDNTP